MFEQKLNKYWRTVVDTIQDGIMIVDTKTSSFRLIQDIF
jgi:hypothetical protein